MRWFDRLSIEGKLIVITLAASLVPAIVACTLFTFYDRDNSRRTMKEDLIVMAEGVAINVTPALEFESLDPARDILGAMRADPRIEMAVIYDRGGNSVDYQRADLRPPVVPVLSRTEGAYFEDGKLRIHKVVAREGKFLGTIFIQCDTKELSHRMTNDAGVVVIVALVSLLTALPLASQLHKLIVHTTP